MRKNFELELYKYCPNYIRDVHIDIIFYGKADGEVTLSHEDKDWQYFAIEDLPSNIAYKHRAAIVDWANKH